MQYIDVNGRIHTRMLRGASGKTYGNLLLMSQAELDDVLADGISVYTPPPEPTPDPEDVKRKAVAEIKRQAQKDIDAIADIETRLSMVAETLSLIKDSINIPPAKQARIDELHAVYLSVKAIRDKAASDVAAL